MQNSKEIENKIAICPSCGEMAVEILETFTAIDTWRYTGNKYKKIPGNTIEAFSIVCNKCKSKLPDEIVERVIPLMPDTKP